ncbi:phenylalanine 4-monooxygenase [Thiotrichales bacterium 19S9-12]|nr:phenylalanine 4-monooxygenase [Thiotrichales bacterium 19S9-11]MCF6811725.1 phenylalanine 4-monooxygenase [Thiotrichales bacterium 19S9-12]
MTKSTQYKSKKPNSQGFIDYTDTENNVWQTLIERQLEIVKTRACSEYIKGLDIVDFPLNKIPQIPDLNKRLKANGGWQVEAVPALINFDRFFGLLGSRKFPCATFIRTPDELEYLQEPDIFHELFGHCPMLTDPVYADVIHNYGKLGIGAKPYVQKLLARFYWFTAEFGLIQQPDDKLKCYGGGILSSIGETLYAVEDIAPKRKAFDPLEILRTPYRIDIMQPIYFVIESFEQLYSVMNESILDLIEEAQELGDYPPEYPPVSSEANDKLTNMPMC